MFDMEFPLSDDALAAQTLNDVDSIDRWSIYTRLKQLSIACECSINRPLQVQIETATEAIQTWSVVQQFRGSRQDRLERLERCWRQPSHRHLVR
jgi:hypothetical protein